MKSSAYVLTLIFICLYCTSVSGQFGGGGFGATSSQNPSDTTKSNFFTIFKGNPGKAALYSLIIPGAGQLYNKRWWKVPLVYGLEGSAIYFYLKSNDDFNQWNTCYISQISDDIPFDTRNCTTDSGFVVQDQNRAFLFRNGARNNRETAILLAIGAHLFQSLEAFIDRHLIDFDVDEDLSFQLGPSQLEPNLVGIRNLNIISISIPIGR